MFLLSCSKESEEFLCNGREATVSVLRAVHCFKVITCAKAAGQLIIVGTLWPPSQVVNLPVDPPINFCHAPENGPLHKCTNRIDIVHVKTSSDYREKKNIMERMLAHVGQSRIELQRGVCW